MKRFFDIIVSLLGLVFLSPLFMILAFWIKLDSRGSVFFKQQRVGKGNCNFVLYKFRSMRMDSDKMGSLTIGSRDFRVTRSGYYIRKYKLDEIPQLINVLIGNMSLVGPRPEVRKYVDLYNDEQLEVLSVLPGITDLASICYLNENELLSKCDNPEKYYIEVIMPDKLKLNLVYIRKQNFIYDIRLILKTLMKILR